ncbi:hypothetical protein T484DRAFT_1755568 [Baffinella frigidus]|nr:hypothetical protein T484DRAFT_1755568 [Cryptophyta sp. CCMP2293]
MLVPPSPHLFLLNGDYTADAFENMAPKVHTSELAIANEEDTSLAATCPATPEDPDSRASRSSSPGGSKRGRDDTALQEESDLALVSRKLARIVLSGEKNKVLEFEIPHSMWVDEDEGTDFDWLCTEFCVSA